MGMSVVLFIRLYMYVLCSFFLLLNIFGLKMYRLFNVLFWIWNIYEGTELPSVYFITNTKHCTFV